MEEIDGLSGQNDSLSSEVDVLKTERDFLKSKTFEVLRVDMLLISAVEQLTGTREEAVTMASQVGGNKLLCKRLTY